jgi:hypothetical protein
MSFMPCWKDDMGCAGALQHVLDRAAATAVTVAAAWDDAVAADTGIDHGARLARTLARKPSRSQHSIQR